MTAKYDNDRRRFFKTACLAAGALALSKFDIAKADEEKKVSPSEDLMREHGALRRILLIYGEISERLKNGKNFPPEALLQSADIIRSFVEDYHEKLEEDYLFPRFEKAGKLSDLVKTLRGQHQAGRILTDLVKNNASAKPISKNKDALLRYLNEFTRMYRPHAAREDTILFPEFRKIVSDKEYDSLGEEFEKKEQQLFGEDGFEKMVSKVEGIEKTLGIYELAQFTPKVQKSAK